MYESRKKSSFALLDEMERSENIRSTDILSRKQRLDIRLTSETEANSIMAKTPQFLIGVILFCIGLGAFKTWLIFIGLVFIVSGIVKSSQAFFGEKERDNDGK